MSVLREAFESAGYSDVQTYIASGNVIFGGPTKVSEADIEVMLEEQLGFPIVVVVRSRSQLLGVVERAPAGFGERPDDYHSDAVFLKEPLTSAQAMRVVQLRDGVDAAWPGSGVVYFQRLSSERTKSKMAKIVGTPEYKLMTIRSWNTTTKLAMLASE